MQPACILGEVTTLELLSYLPLLVRGGNDVSNLLSACRDLGLVVINVPLW